MCTFLNELPSKSKTGGTTRRKAFLELYLRETKDKNVYRFRILAFTSSSSDRDYPFIEKYVHETWGKNENGKNVVIASVTCPTTKYVGFDGDPYTSCPVCKFSNQNFITFKNTNYKDRISANKCNKSKRQFKGIIPVYVVQDPNVPENNGKCKAIVFTDKDLYDEVIKKIKNTQKEYSVFNGKGAVDFWVTVNNEEVVYNEGQPNERRFSRNIINKFGFSTKPYDINVIDKEMIDSFPFDEEFYITDTLEEIQEYFNKYVAQPTVEIPDNDLNIDNDDKNKKDKKNKKKNSGSVTVIAEETDKTNDEDVSSIINDIDIDDIINNDSGKTDKSDKNETSTESDMDLDLSEIDKILNEDLNIEDNAVVPV